MEPPNWDPIVDQVFTETRKSIREFSERHPDEICSQINFFSVDLSGGFLSLGFDTPESAIRSAHQHYERRIADAREKLTEPFWQRDAFSILKEMNLQVGNWDIDDVAYINEVDWEFEEVGEFAMSDDYPEPHKEGGYESDDYLQLSMALCVWRVVERLDNEKVFDLLPTTGQCVVSYCEHDQAYTIMRILNWPEIKPAPPRHTLLF